MSKERRSPQQQLIVAREHIERIWRQWIGVKRTPRRYDGSEHDTNLDREQARLKRRMDRLENFKIKSEIKHGGGARRKKGLNPL